MIDARLLGAVGAIIAAIASWCVPALAERRVALVIGNTSYMHAGVLRNPLNDAEDIAARLKEFGFETIVGRDASIQGMTALIREFRNRLEGADVGLFFYAGHAMQFGNQNYLLPIDARIDDELDIERQTIRLDMIVAEMERQVRVNLVFLDACRNNPLAERLARSVGARARSVGLSRGLAPVAAQGTDTLIMFAAAPAEVADDGPGRNSPFTAALLKHMGQTEEVSVMLKDVVAEVRAATGGKQRPQQLAAMGRKFYLAPPADTVKPDAFRKAPDKPPALDADPRKAALPIPLPPPFSPGPRNPFGVPDVSDPYGEDVRRFAAGTQLRGDPADPNASAWAKQAPDGKHGSLDGTWSGRWSQGTGTARIRESGERLYVLYTDLTGSLAGRSWLLEAVREGPNRLVGRWVQVGTPHDTGPYVGLIVNDERIDGTWSGGTRWDFRRALGTSLHSPGGLRNPFGVPDVLDPYGADVRSFAARIRLLGGSSDQNASQWAERAPDGKRGSLDGTWSGRWTHGNGKAQVREANGRLYVLYTDSTGRMAGRTWLLEAIREGGNRLVGRWVQLANPSDTGPFVGIIVDDERIDGTWGGGARWDFRRQLR